MTKKQDELIILQEGTVKHEYIVHSKIGSSGSTGHVYLVQEKDTSNYFALKECHLEDSTYKKLFREEAQEMMTHPLDYFVNIRKVGIISANNGKNEHEALLMDYGGSDVSQLYHYLKDVSSTVREAISYKIMYTVISALESAHKKNKSHGDLLLRNILSGVNLANLKNEYDNKKLSLEEINNNLIFGEVRLCDRTSSGQLGTFSLNNSSLKGNDLEQEMYLRDPVTRDPFQRDIYAAVALCSLLTDREDFVSVSEFAKSFFGVEKLGKDRQTKESIYPNLSDLKKRLGDKIKKDYNGYFHLMSSTKSAGKNRFIVTRPIDRFMDYWEIDEIINLSQLEQFYSDHVFSYTKLRNCGDENYHPNTEKQQLRVIFSTILDGVVDRTIDVIKTNNAKLKPLLDQERSLDQIIEGLSSEISSLDGELSSLKQKRVDLAQQHVTNINDDSLLQQMLDASSEQKNKEASLQSKKEEFSERSTEKTGLLEEKERFNTAPYLTMIHYVGNKCLNDVDSKLKDQISKKIKPFMEQ